MFDKDLSWSPDAASTSSACGTIAISTGSEFFRGTYLKLVRGWRNTDCTASNILDVYDTVVLYWNFGDIHLCTVEPVLFEISFEKKKPSGGSRAGNISQRCSYPKP